MTVKRTRYNSGCLFCSTLGDRGLINHHLNKFVPLLASKLKSISKVSIDDFHPVDIVKASRYDKQSPRIRTKITEEEWDRPELTEWIVLSEFGKRAVVPLSGPNVMEKHRSRVRIPKRWWEDKIAEAVYYANSGNFNLDAFVADVLEEAYHIWYPGEEHIAFGDENESVWYSGTEGSNFSGSSSTVSPLAPRPKSSAYIASRMAAIEMDPEDDQEFLKREETPHPMKQKKRQRGFDFSREYEEADFEKKPIKRQTDSKVFRF